MRKVYCINERIFNALKNLFRKWLSVINKKLMKALLVNEYVSVIIFEIDPKIRLKLIKLK